MRLYNRNGTFDLPDGFALNLERTNPFFTDEGDTSVPVTLPSSPHNLQLLGHIERIDAKSNDLAKAEAWLTIGAVTVKGTLIIDTISMEDGIDAAFTFRNGGLYIEYRDKSLKELFSDIVDDTYSEAREWGNHLESIYNGTILHEDYTCFPVFGQKEDGFSGGHCPINYVVGNSLVYQQRIYYEGGVLLYVPEGYACTPFIYLHRMISIMFEKMGYAVKYNCFETLPNKFVVLNNCVDTIINGKLLYADMVPDMTVSDFLNWLLDRFMTQVIVDSNTMTVNVWPFSGLLGSDIGNGTDMDITDMLISGITMRYEQPSRIVVTPTVGDGAQAAASSKKALKDKYGSWVELAESEYWSIRNNNNPAYEDCLVMRRATGMYYELQRDVNTGEIVMVEIGTNYFAYDRGNADNSESFSPCDVMPAMYCDAAAHLMPIIGDHIHNHSTYEGIKANGKQDLIVVLEWQDGEHHSGFKRCGTTQNYIPLIDQGVSGSVLALGSTPEQLYGFFWSQYNNILLNGKKTATMRVNYDTPTFLTLDMAYPKTCRNQKVLPVKSAMNVGAKASNGNSEFVVIRQVYDLTDSYISPGAVSRFRWVMDNKQLLGFKAQCLTVPKYYDENWNEIPGDSHDLYWTGNRIPPETVEVIVSGNNAQIFLGPPSEAGLHLSVPVTVTVKGKIICTHIYTPAIGSPQVQSYTYDFSYTGNNIYVYFTSEAY